MSRPKPPGPIARPEAHVKAGRRRYETRAERDRRLSKIFEQRRKAEADAADEKIRLAIAGEWDVCCIPGCEERPTAPGGVVNREPGPLALPICTRHVVIARSMGQSRWANPDFVQMREVYARQVIEDEEAAEEARERRVENGPTELPQIYFVRVGELVKVGWSSTLRSRLKSYGADTEVLCHYPGSRADETTLHRQLRPSLAKGREWYFDCPAVRLFIDDAIARYGKPTVEPFWTEPRAATVAGKRYR